MVTLHIFPGHVLKPFISLPRCVLTTVMSSGTQVWKCKDDVSGTAVSYYIGSDRDGWNWDFKDVEMSLRVPKYTVMSDHFD